jgi:hypothetical protein
MIRIGKRIISCSAQTDGTTRTSNAKDGSTFDIRAQPHTIDQSSVQRGASDTCNRNDEQRIEVMPGQPCTFEGRIDRTYSQFLRHFKPSGVRLAP